MARMRVKFALILLCGGLVCEVGGSCLPANFFADLAGGLIQTTASTMLDTILSVLLNPAGAA